MAIGGGALVELHLSGPVMWSTQWWIERLVIPSLIATLFAFIVAQLVQRHVALRELRTQAVNRCIALISELEQKSMEYWLRDQSPSDAIAEERIESILMEVIDLRLRFQARRILLVEDTQAPANEQLIELLTGTPFRSVERATNLQRAREIARSLNEVCKSILEKREARLAQFLGW